DRFIPTRRSLLSRLKSMEDDQSWRCFFDTYWKLIYGAALKSGLSHQQAQDVVQDTVVSVARNIASFRYDPTHCSFKSWLLRVTRSRILNCLRKEKRQVATGAGVDDDGSSTSVIERVPDLGGSSLDAIWDEEWEKNLVDASLTRVKRRVDIEQYHIF